jgi:hypothetical protein
VLLDQVRLEDKGLDLVIDNNEFKIGDDSYKLPCLGIMIAARVKITANAVPQVLCLADVNYLTRRILMDVDTGGCGQTFEFLSDSH